MEFIKPNTNFNFVGIRRLAYAFSLTLILVGLGSMVWKGGPVYGIDFAGGAEVLVSFQQPVDIGKVKSELRAMNLKAISVQQYGDKPGLEYRILVGGDDSGETGLGQRIADELGTRTGVKASLEQYEMVGPQVGRDMREKALLAIFFSLLLITVYISGRFEYKWLISASMAAALGLSVYVLQAFNLGMTSLIIFAMVLSLLLFWFLNLKYAMGAIVALIHDVAITVGVFSLAGKEFTLPIIAAILTIIGYSLNDTIIVFDRIRENLRKSSREPLAQIINKSINETLSRTILTSGTTLLVVVCLFVLGGGIIHDFTFALLVGIVIGTYSSIFVASPILLAWQRRKIAKA